MCQLCDEADAYLAEIEARPVADCWVQVVPLSVERNTPTSEKSVLRE